MLELIIRNSLDIVVRTERLIDRARRLIGSGSLDDVEAFRVFREIERLTDVVFVMDEATRLLRRMFEMRPEIARPYTVHATMQ
ncbi:hypothetical protein AB4Z52_25800 [Rhizobium sp. 2YAF20]|uniref:hypothetical protein n=1 Tax=Rhizobium sp. 2YAF20 TaxID=3233027 RepID=UPI003F9A5DEC